MPSRSAAERQRHLESQRERLVAEWDDLGFEELQRTIREVVDRVDVDGPAMQLFMRS